MAFNKLFIGILAVCGFLGASRPAGAQIQSWRDANGVLTLSNRGLNGVPAVQVRVGSPVLARSNPLYEALIRQHASFHRIRADLVRAVIQVESAFNPRAVSPKGAMGLMQLMPATAKDLGVVDPFNPSENIRGGVTYLRQLLDRYDDDEQLALAAYNAGPGAVNKYGNKVPPYKETQNYVRKIASIQPAASHTSVSRIYRVTEIIDGRPVVKYTNTRPASSATYEEVRR